MHHLKCTMNYEYRYINIVIFLQVYITLRLGVMFRFHGTRIAMFLAWGHENNYRDQLKNTLMWWSGSDWIYVLILIWSFCTHLFHACIYMA